jgi:hypothetical protein
MCSLSRQTFALNVSSNRAIKIGVNLPYDRIFMRCFLKSICRRVTKLDTYLRKSN